MLSLEASTELCRVLGDATRLRLLRLLASEELTVAELVKITQLSQSRVSTHLGKLREAKIVRDRKSGTSSFYSANLDALPEESRSIVETIGRVVDDPLLEDDLERIAEVVRARADGKWADSVAGRMHRHYSPGRTWEAASRAMLGWARLGHVIDIASGDGVLTELIAHQARRVTCVDSSDRVVAAARDRLAPFENVAVVEGDMHALPFEDRTFDQAALMNALTYADDPKRVLEEVHRVLVPGGTLIGSTLDRHRHSDLVAKYNHVRLGFTPVELRELLESSGFIVDLCDVTCRERVAPHFANVTIHARRPDPEDPR